MKISLEETSLKSAPHAFIHRRGEPVLIRMLETSRHEDLLKMYLAYQPRNSFNNLPPLDDSLCESWAQNMIDNALNVVALSFKDGVVGHVALFTMNETMCELLIVVSPGYQSIGVGTQLTRCAIQLAYEMGFQKIWLCVETGNMSARHVYSKCGFQYLGKEDMDDVEMSFDLSHYHQGLDDSISKLLNRDAVAINQAASCKEAYQLCVEHNIGALPMVNDSDEVVGILTATDLIRTTNPSQIIRDVATMGVVVVEDSSPIARVVRLFQDRHLRCIPVVNSRKKFVGIIGRHEVLRHIGEQIWTNGNNGEG